jgi:hypothetical protein
VQSQWQIDEFHPLKLTPAAVILTTEARKDPNRADPGQQSLRTASPKHHEHPMTNVKITARKFDNYWTAI